MPPEKRANRVAGGVFSPPKRQADCFLGAGVSGTISVPTKGGAMGGGGPVIVDGMLFVNSGYGAPAGRPGNVLLAFGVE